MSASRDTQVAPSAVVEPGAEIGDGTRVWDLTQVRTGARIGRSCTIGRNVFVDQGVVIGDRCKVQNNALLYAPATLADGVFIGPGAILTNDRFPRAVAPDGQAKGAADWQSDGVTVAEGASVGAGAVVVAGVTVGPWSTVAAGAVVASDVPAFALVAGVPARPMGWVGRAGVRLEPTGEPGRWRCPTTGEAYLEKDGGLCPIS